MFGSYGANVVPAGSFNNILLLRSKPLIVSCSKSQTISLIIAKPCEAREYIRKCKSSLLGRSNTLLKRDNVVHLAP